jgi:hypothetical protein
MESNGKPKRQMRVIEFIEEISRTSNYFSFLLKNLNHSNDFDVVVKLFYVYILKIFKKKDFVIIRKKKCKVIIFGRKKDIFKIFFVNEFFFKINNIQSNKQEVFQSRFNYISKLIIRSNYKLRFSKKKFFFLMIILESSTNNIWGILINVFKKIYFEKKISILKTKKSKIRLNLLISKNFNILKNIEIQCYLQIVNKIIKEEYFNFPTNGFLGITSIDNSNIFLEGLTVIILKKNNLVFSHQSGGQKTIISFCLILSNHFFQRPNLYIFDEINAALDFKNVKKLSFKLKSRIKKSQLLIIALRNNMIPIINHLFFIYRFEKKIKIINLKI